ncbi:NAD-dependent epimerase/dehydratase family protein [Mucilaginibacter rigui]|uniref:NAD-dependent epimerase/dehydratase family protein n=1 Tax=Mucilaginibacter rigui TaxID=534635 RepID=A0ABR7X6N8_9SPHI|nr:NAD-dependent epimerase/dehydratase family protein [Mucilaginibacter rigui]MBD1386239.1 NAD-dependent epimerase/dehydratase family protein [Mucilaginibacter rigui]
MNNILISGASGFVGQNLSEYLTDAGHDVFKLIRGANTDSNEISWTNLSSFFTIDIDVIIHLAGKAHDIKNTSNPQEYFDINTGLTIKLFDNFLKSKATRFIYFSSVKAVADTVDGVLNETVKPNPQTAYGKSKLKAEEYIISKELPKDKHVYILRPCMIHGRGNKGNLNLLYKFVSKGIPYPLAAFDNRRSFLYIENLNFIIGKLIESNTAPSGVYNIADDESLSTVEIVKIISQTLNRKPNLWYVNQSFLKFTASIGDKLKLPLNSERLKKLTENYVVSNQKIKNALQITNLPVRTQDGLTQTIKSFNK